MAAGNRVVLTFVGDTKDLERAFNRVGESAVGLKVLLGAALAPAAGPVMASATGAVLGLGAALAGAGAAAGVFGAVMKTSFGEIQQASAKTQQLQDKIRLLGERIKVANQTGIGDAEKLAKAQAAAQNELLARYRLMPPALRQVTMAYDGLKTSWQAFVDKNKPQTFGIMTGGFKLLSTIIPKLQPLFDMAAGAVSRLVGYLTKAGQGGGIEKLVGWLTAQAGPAFDNLGRIAKGIVTTIANLFSGFAPTGQGFLDWLAGAADKMAAWSQGNGLQDFIKYATDNMPSVVTALEGLAGTVGKIAQAVAPFAPISLAIATGLSGIINAVPADVLTVIVGAWVAWATAVKLYALYTMAAALVTQGWAVAQTALNVAMSLNPVVLIVLAIIALVAIIVIIATKTHWFQTLWKKAWGGIKAAAHAVGSWFKDTLWPWIKGVWEGIKDKAVGVWNWMKGLPGKLKTAFAKVKDYLLAPFRAAFNLVADAWNNTIGRLSWTVPSWIPGVGGNTISAPKLPHFHSGGVVPGIPGSEMLAVLQAGEKVSPATSSAGSDSGGWVKLDLGPAILDMVRDEVRKRGGRASHLGVRVVNGAVRA